MDTATAANTKPSRVAAYSIVLILSKDAGVVQEHVTNVGLLGQDGRDHEFLGDVQHRLIGLQYHIATVKPGEGVGCMHMHRHMHMHSTAPFPTPRTAMSSSATVPRTPPTVA